MTQAASVARNKGETSSQRKAILRISADLFAKKGFQAVGVAEIGEAARLGRGALYYHIGSKEQLLFDIVVKYISELVVEGSQILADTTDPVLRIKRLSRAMMAVVSRNKSELTLCFRETESLTGPRHRTVAKLHSNYQTLWAQTLSDGCRKGVFRPLPSVALKGLLGMYFHSFLWLKTRGKSSADDIADIFSDIVLRAVQAD